MIGRFDRESAELIDKLERARDSVIILMDKKESLQATRHARLVACLEDVNKALGIIFRRLTSVEGNRLHGARHTSNTRGIIELRNNRSVLRDQLDR